MITLGQLEEIVKAYKSDCIPQLFPNIEFFVGHMELIKRVRNMYSHMFPCITRDTKGLEVHVLDGANNFQSFVLQTGTPINQADAANFAFGVGDFNRDGSPDLYCIKHSNTGTKSLEVHILNGADKFQSFLLQTGTPINQTDAANFAFAVGDFNHDGIADLYCMKFNNTGTNRLEVHIVNLGPPAVM